MPPPAQSQLTLRSVLTSCRPRRNGAIRSAAAVETVVSAAGAVDVELPCAAAAARSFAGTE